MIDIHNHILPNIDDGPTNETEMMDLLKQATTQGVNRNHCNITSLTSSIYHTYRKSEIMFKPY